MTVGNKEGMSLIERVDRLEQGHGQLRVEHNLLQSKHNYLRSEHNPLQTRPFSLSIWRAQVLDDWPKFVYDDLEKLRDSRSMAAHDGNVVEDLLLIKEMSEPNPPRGRWREACERTYELHDTTCFNEIQSWPEIVEVSNVIVNVKQLGRWAEREKSRAPWR